MNAGAKVSVEALEDGAVRRVVLDAPKANVIDGVMTGSLRAAVADAAADPAVKAVLFEGAGPHFSFGASVEEHLPGAVAGMLAAFHGLMRDLLASPLVLLAAVRGKCLGGGLELASFCHRVFASPDASLGQPEIVLGVFAPMASAFLPERVGRPAAEDLCLTGRAVGAAEALSMRLVDEVAEDPRAAALAWARQHLGARSASSLRHAVRAARAGLAPRLLAALGAVERQYLDGLMATADAEEGVRAFLEKRSPRWRNA